MPSLIYLDNSSASAPSQKVVSAMMPYLTTHWGIPSAPHQKGQELFPAMEEFYRTIYSFLGASEESQIVLTSSGAEAVNHVVSSVYRDVTMQTGKNQFLSSKADEAPSIMAISHLEPFGCVGKMIEVNAHGIATPEAVADVFSPRTALVSLSWANGLTGAIQPIAEIAALCRQRGVKLHVDATHVLGKLYFDLNEIDPDFLTFNADQLHGPKGAGILYIKPGTRCSPFIFGSADQAGMRAGGVNMPALAGLAMAAKEAIDSRDLVCTETARLRNQLEDGIVKRFPHAIICLKSQERLPHCTTMLFPGIANELLLFSLNRKGVCAGIGGGNFQQLALMLACMGMEEKLAGTAVSFSLSRYTTEDEIDRAIDIVAESATQLSKISEAFLFEETRRV